MTTGTSASVTHGTSIRSAPDDVYGLVADVTRWPVIFGPTVHVEHLDRTASTERFTIWALVNDRVAHWTSERAFDPLARRITFRQAHTRPPVSSMGGRWEFLDRPELGTEVVLTHEFSMAGDAADEAAQFTEALDRNSDSELAALRKVAESGHPLNALIFAFEDAVQVAGPAGAAYEFIDRADQWDRRLPHVRAVTLGEPEPGIQHLTMETATADGAVHTTSSVRVCAPGRWIGYKQTVAPAPLLGHSGTWSFRDLGESGCLIVARHLVMLDPSVPGPLGEVARRVRAALSGNSRATLDLARKFAEQR
jgi:aromatase